MKRLFRIACLLTAFGSASAQPHDPQQQPMKTLVVCFSATGTTARVAERLAAATGGTLFRIQPAQPYTAADLDWTDRRSRSSREMNDPQSRPALANRLTDTADYAVVYLGFPVWWESAPRIVHTFLESHDLGGKRIIPFATSGGSGIRRACDRLKAAYPQLRWEEGRLLNRPSDSELEAWTQTHR